METNMERIAAKAQNDANLRLTSLTHHITKDLVWDSLSHIANNSVTGIDEIDIKQA